VADRRQAAPDRSSGAGAGQHDARREGADDGREPEGRGRGGECEAESKERRA
jgi:hypothetical protein